jgi:hypothetical protein
MAAEIGDQRRQTVVVVAREQPRDMRLVADIAGQPGPPCRPALIGQRRVFGVGTIVDPFLDGLASATPSTIFPTTRRGCFG